ncbi:hypothetical protein SKAU_G00074070 [Synaphobranchus kaupii]|uniref:Uncharacterized protein n=1 Tax=Synaphobranchus kaupii TaxID=118154 RepID=A0A9Q1G8F0_SYNKA|nr:hypothetical protein SKAU_G00074070 [Synaphobranchus kaupii]
MVFTKKLSLAKAVFYVIAQCLGAIVGDGLMMELFITFELVFTVFATCDAKRNDLKGSSGLAIGLAVSIGHLFAVPYTGARHEPGSLIRPGGGELQWKNTLGEREQQSRAGRGPRVLLWWAPSWEGCWPPPLYEYLFCPDPDLKRPFGGVFAKDSDPPAQGTRVWRTAGSGGDVDELAIGPGPVRLLDVRRTSCEYAPLYGSRYQPPGYWPS